MPSKSKSVSSIRNFKSNNGFIRRPAATEALQDRQVFSGESFTELAVHMEHVAGTNDIAFADFNRGRMTHRPSWFGGGTEKYALVVRKL